MTDPNSTLPLVQAYKEIDRLKAEALHWRAEYKTLEAAGDALVKQRDSLKEENARLVATLVNIAEYWNGSHSDEAMRDACERIPMLANAGLCGKMEGKA